MKGYQKIILGIFISILVFLGGLQFYFSFFLDQQLKETAITRFHNATDNAYDLEIEKFDLWVLARKLNASGIQITSKEDSTHSGIRTSVDRFTISGVSFLKLLFSQSLKLNKTEILNPSVNITSRSIQKESNRDLETLSRQFSEAALKEFDSISISNIIIRGFSLDYNREDLSITPLLSFKNSDIRLSDVSIDTASVKEDRILPTDNFTTTFRDISYQTTNGLYDVTADAIRFFSADGKMEMDTIRVKPKFNREKFADQVKHEIDRITLDLHKINWEGINTAKLNRAEEFSSRYLALKKADIDIYRDKRPPFPPSNRPPLPLQMLRNIPFPISVDSISLINSSLRYSERLPKAEEPGFIEFANLSATMEEVSNQEQLWKQGDTPTLHAETDIMGKARLAADFSFAMTDSSDLQKIQGTLNPLDMTTLNETLVPLAFLHIDQGKLLGMDFDMTLGEHRANGKVKLRYENLKISLLDKETNQQNFGSKVTSLMANTFKIKSDNKGEDLRIGQVDFKRLKNKSTFNYWWKSLLSGLKSSIGL